MNEEIIPYKVIELDEKFENVSATEIRKHLADVCNSMSIGPNGTPFNVYMEEIEDYKETGKTYKDYENMKDKVEDAILNAEHVIAHTPIFDLVEKPAPYADKPDFKPVGINSRDWATIIVEKDKKFLCVKQLRYGLMKEFVEFPCGMVEDDEQPAYAAKRELEEETGIHLAKGIDGIAYLGKFSPNPAFMNNYMHYFYVNLDTAEFVQCDKKPDENERIDTLWKSKDDFYREYVESHGSVMMGLAFKLYEERQLQDIT